ncbi:MAG: capsular polysaccharide biosynthesis protein [Silicimonas sp.]|nr:capsular polysaccharide biosynthesis protein [Silicimonas sp.]
MTDSTTRNTLRVYSGGFSEGRLKRILDLAGWDVRLGLPEEGDHVGIWGRSPTAWRGEAVAGWAEAPVLTVEDAFLRSVHPNRLRPSPPLGLCLDRTGVHFDGSAPSDLEKLLATHPLDDTALLNRARAAIDQLRHWHLGKYSATDPGLEPPDPGYVVVIDQTEGDAALDGAGRADFLEMLVQAGEDNPGCPIYVKRHPESTGGARGGHFRDEDFNGRIQPLETPISPWRLFEGAVAVYTHSSTLGFEAIFAGHKPRVFGAPFYAGWGRTIDAAPLPRRGRDLTRAQLFAAAMILYPVWYDPNADRLCQIEEVIAQLAAEARAWREDRAGYAMIGMKPWKRPHLARAFGREKRLRFSHRGGDRQKVVWGMAEAPEGALRMEDGFLRSRGLGATLTPPLSLVFDAPSLYFDAATPGRLDALIAESVDLPLAEIQRIERLIRRINRLSLTKYNIGAEMPDLPDRAPKLLIVGQVEDDASVLHGGADLRSNRALLEAARRAHPEACLIYKPHPDVLSGLRDGALPEEARGLANVVLGDTSADAALGAVDRVWTLTSTLGFEALLRGVPVTCLGMPFYAGRGLTDDRVARPAHRNMEATLEGLAHACLIGYPRYFDPRSGAPISPEAAVDLLASGVEFPRMNRWLMRLNGWLTPLRR